MKLRYLFFLVILTAVLLACDTDEDTAPATEPAPDATGYPAPDTRPAEPAPTTASGYPAPPPADTGYPAPPPADAGYPAPPAIPPPSQGYPGDTVWIVHAAGEQCAADLTYPDVDAAIRSLEENGVPVFAAEQVSLAVCAACGCPTSEHYRILTERECLPRAESLGWTQE